MKVPPKKPHFFKPIQPGFKHGVKIPVGFLKYLKGQQQEHAVLRRAGKKWLVKVNGRNLEEGWETFAEEHDLHLGDILVFRHEGNMVFEVVIFDSSHCDREYAEHMQEEAKEEDEEAEEEEEEVEQEEKEEDEEATRFKKFELKGTSGFIWEKPSTSGEDDLPHFISTIKPYSISHRLLHLPTDFAKSNGLMDRKCEMILKDEAQRSWSVWLARSDARHVGITRGWNKFRIANGLKVGDAYKFVLIKNGKIPIAYFRVGDAYKFELIKNGKTPAFFQYRPDPSINLSSKVSPHVEAATHKPLGHSRFVCTLRPYCLKYGYLLLPKQFALASCLNKKCDLIIRDEWQRSWNLTLRRLGTGVFVRGGWDTFCNTNRLKEGDHIMFEVVTDGDKQIWNFHVDCTRVMLWHSHWILITLSLDGERDREAVPRSVSQIWPIITPCSLREV